MNNMTTPSRSRRADYSRVADLDLLSEQTSISLLCIGDASAGMHVSTLPGKVNLTGNASRGSMRSDKEEQKGQDKWNEATGTESRGK